MDLKFKPPPAGDRVKAPIDVQNSPEELTSACHYPVGPCIKRRNRTPRCTQFSRGGGRAGRKAGIKVQTWQAGEDTPMSTDLKGVG